MIEEVYSKRDDITSAEEIWARAIPIALHGDAVPLGKTSLDTVSWSGVFMHTMPTIDFKIMLSCLVSRCKSASTVGTFWKVLTWALNIMLYGRWPMTDWEGEMYPVGTVEGTGQANTSVEA